MYTLELNQTHIEAIWDIYLKKTSPTLIKQLKPVKNLLGSAEYHKQLFIESFKEYQLTYVQKEL